MCIIENGAGQTRRLCSFPFSFMCFSIYPYPLGKKSTTEKPIQKYKFIKFAIRLKVGWTINALIVFVVGRKNINAQVNVLLLIWNTEHFAPHQTNVNVIKSVLIGISFDIDCGGQYMWSCLQFASNSLHNHSGAVYYFITHVNNLCVTNTSAVTIKKWF